ncbi:hypothetical protein, partial [Phenylobacterium aquaticum]|uniref:hypothetical protein n=1 Tax=Phenylobacterium aquaticum TaxID=1763816 RepID=UPI0026F18C39
MGRNHFICGLVAAVAAVLLANESAAASQPECFDVEVSARITRQTPTIAGDCGPDCIIMSWPWIVDLDVGRVYAGNLMRGPLTVQTL